MADNKQSTPPPQEDVKEETAKNQTDKCESASPARREDEEASTKPADADGASSAAEEEVTSGNWVLPQVELKQIDVVTGEEGEEEVWSNRAKLYRWSEGQWKDRGVGDAKLLKDQDGKIRFLLRQEKTGKLVANHYVLPIDEQCKLKPNAGSDKIWVWSVLDCAENPHTVEQFGLRFGSAEAATKFKEEFEKVAESNKKLHEEGKFA